MKVCPVCGLECEDEARFCPRDGAVLETKVTDPLLGKVLLGQFEVEELIGQGTTGTVYRARQLRVDRPVAIKLLRPELASEAIVIERFHREAKAVAKLSHPNIITVHLVAETERGLPYLVMEYVEGEDLQEVLTKQAPLPPEKIRELGMQIADALAEAHAQGIVHRDLKPANIKLTIRGGRTTIKVLDFGIAKILQEDGQGKLTKTGTVFGTPHYVSPEQASGAKVDHRTDIYSLGVILFQMATGRLPFESTSGLEVLVKHIKEQPPKPSSIVETVPPELERIILKALEKEPETRHASARDLAEELESLSRKQANSTQRQKKTSQTLDMTGWNRDKSRTQPSTTSATTSKTGTRISFGMATEKDSIAAQVARRVQDRRGAKPADAQTPPKKGPMAEPTSPSSATPVPGQAQSSGSTRPQNPRDDGTVVEPATDYASGRATSMSIPTASEIAPAPARYVRPPQGPDTVVDDKPPTPEPPDTSAQPPAASVPAPMNPAPAAPDQPVSNEAAFPSPAPEPESAWSISDMEGYHPGGHRGLWAFLITLFLVTAGGVGAFLWYRSHHKKDSPEKTAQASEPKSAPPPAKNAGLRASGADAASNKAPTATSITTKGVRLAAKQTKADIHVGNLSVVLNLSRPARVGRQSDVTLSVQGMGEAPLVSHLVTPEGQLVAVRLHGKDGRYHATISWGTLGLHRLVVSCTKNQKRFMMWFSIPVSGTKHHGNAHGHGARGSRPPRLPMDPYAAEPTTPKPRHEPGARPIPTRPDPSSPPPGEEGLPAPPDEPPTTPPPREPPGETGPGGGDDLPPPPPDDGT